MVNKLSILLGLCAFSSVGFAQDSTYIQQDKFIAQTSLQEIGRRNLLDVASLVPTYYQNKFTSVQVGYDYHSQEKYDWQKGSGFRNLSFSSETFQKLDHGVTVWGNANFISKKVNDVKYNETLDYEQVYPYFLADTVGGKLNQETYYFGGGIAKESGKWTYAAEGYYTANQGYRQVDPRPLNKSSFIELQGSAARNIGSSYRLSAAVDYDFYKQTSKLYFVSNLGRPLIFNLNGPGAYNFLLTGMGSSSNALAYYENHTLTGTVVWNPIESGVYAKARVAQRTGEKFTNHTNESVNFWTDEQLQLDLGYFKSYENFYWRTIGSWSSQRMTGVDGLFTTQSSSGSGGYNKLVDRSSYRSFKDRYAFNIEVGHSKKWSAELEVAYQDNQEQYISPFRNMEWSPLDISLSGQYFVKQKSNLFVPSLKVAKRSIEQSAYSFSNVNFDSGIGQLLSNNWEFRLMKPIFAQAELLYLINLNKGVSPFVKINAGYATEVELNRYSLHLGVNF